MRLIRTLLGSPVEVVSSLVLIGAGIYVTSIGSGTTHHRSGLLTVGGVLTAFGGILVAWITSRSYSREQARLEFGQQLGNLSRNVGQAAGQISQAVEQAQSREIHPATGFALISQATRTIYGQVNEIAVIQGAAFDPAYLIETATKLDELAIQLGTREQVEEGAIKDGDLARVREELQNVRTMLRRGPVQRTYSSVDVNCPTCGHKNLIHLGDVPGDTAAGTCQSCGKQYNAHRASDGAAFTRPVRRAPSPERQITDGEEAAIWAFTCPSCQHELRTNVDGTTKSLVCTSCDFGLVVDTSSKDVRLGLKYHRTHSPAGGRSGARPLLACPICGVLRVALMNTGASYIAVCRDDRQMMEITYSEWDTWRSTHQTDDPS